jgi:hypothetical protein
MKKKMWVALLCGALAWAFAEQVTAAPQVDGFSPSEGEAKGVRQVEVKP